MATRVRTRRKAPKIELSSLFDARAVFFLEGGSRDEVLTTMVEGIKQTGKISNEKTFFQALLKREELVSTAIGYGIAIPHAKTEELNHFFLGIGIVQDEGIEWDSDDQIPVRLIMLLGGPKRAESQYLGLLSQTTALLRDHRLDLLNAKTPEEVAQVVAAQEIYGS
ncbi:MAG: PTS sugar transporter subunit IIA [Candidatus Algichlamydia australiensis]|nr:PTS sugar transporter subunit IIA [Chlamydiales bacterium]